MQGYGNTSARRAYLDARCDELLDAIERGDGDGGVAVLRQMTADGYGDQAEQITNGLVAIGLRRLANQVEKGETSALNIFQPNIRTR